MNTAGPYLLAIITHTPIWVWAVFALVLYLGYQRTRDRSVALWRLLLLPLVIMVTAGSGLVGAGLGAAPAIVVGLLVGGVSGWLMERDGATRRLPDGRLWLRGEWASLVQIVAVFIWRYAVAVLTATHPALVADSTWHLLVAFVTSALAALFLGRTAARLRVYFTSTAAAA